MYLASLINKGHEVFITGTTDPTALSAELVLKMATIDGAKTVLWDNEIGSLEVGKKVSLKLFVNIFFYMKEGWFDGFKFPSCVPSCDDGVYFLRFLKFVF